MDSALYPSKDKRRRQETRNYGYVKKPAPLDVGGMSAMIIWGKDTTRLPVVLLSRGFAGFSISLESMEKVGWFLIQTSAWWKGKKKK